MPFLHSAYGLWLRADRPIPGLPIQDSAVDANVTVFWGSMPSWIAGLADGSKVRYARVGADADRDPVMTVWVIGGSYFQFVYADGTEFLVDRAGTFIWSRWREPWTSDDAATYLLGPVFGFLLRLRGTVCLHASAFSMDDQAIALLGPAGAGKSTTAAAFACLGHPVLSDDVLPIVDRGRTFDVQSGYPQLRLWPDAGRVLGELKEALPRLSPNWEKCYLDLSLDGYWFQGSPLPLAAIYILGERRPGPMFPMIEDVSPGVGLIQLVANTYTNYLLDSPMRAHEFDVLSRMIASVPIRRLYPNTDPSTWPTLCDAILSDFRGRVVPSPLG